MKEITTYYDKKKKKLNDEAIVRNLSAAVVYYLDGAILECRDTLSNIIDAIDEFAKHWQM